MLIEAAHESRRKAFAADLLARAREVIDRQRAIEAEVQEVGESPG
jgi:hypothetical protein